MTQIFEKWLQFIHKICLSRTQILHPFPLNPPIHKWLQFTRNTFAKRLCFTSSLTFTWNWRTNTDFQWVTSIDTIYLLKDSVLLHVPGNFTWNLTLIHKNYSQLMHSNDDKGKCPLNVSNTLFYITLNFLHETKPLELQMTHIWNVYAVLEGTDLTCTMVYTLPFSTQITNLPFNTYILHRLFFYTWTIQLHLIALYSTW